MGLEFFRHTAGRILGELTPRIQLTSEGRAAVLAKLKAAGYEITGAELDEYLDTLSDTMKQELAVKLYGMYQQAEEENTLKLKSKIDSLVDPEKK